MSKIKSERSESGMEVGRLWSWGGGGNIGHRGGGG